MGGIVRENKRIFYALKRDSHSPYLAVGGMSFSDLGAKNSNGEGVKEFETVRDAIIYLRGNKVPDVTQIVKVCETIPTAAATYSEYPVD